jgi:hypothetical protein
MFMISTDPRNEKSAPLELYFSCNWVLESSRSFSKKEKRRTPSLVLSCLVLYAPLGRAAALLAGCPPPTTSTMDLQCGADRHPSSPFRYHVDQPRTQIKIKQDRMPHAVQMV